MDVICFILKQHHCVNQEEEEVLKKKNKRMYRKIWMSNCKRSSFIKKIRYCVV